MVLSRRWLKDYVNLDDISDKEFCDEMTLSGSKVEEFKKEGSELENIVVGQIKSLERHPDSDHLWICKVDVGTEADEQIVTGAQIFLLAIMCLRHFPAQRFTTEKTTA